MYRGIQWFLWHDAFNVTENPLLKKVELDKGRHTLVKGRAIKEKITFFETFFSNVPTLQREGGVRP